MISHLINNSNFFSFPRIATTQRRKGSIPKETPWKTLALNERTCKGWRIQYHYVWNGAKARFRWNTSLPQRTFVFHQNQIIPKMPHINKTTISTFLITLNKTLYTIYDNFFKISIYYRKRHKELAFHNKKVTIQLCYSQFADGT